MRLLQILAILLFAQATCFAYSFNYYNSTSPMFNNLWYRRGVMTGIPAPIFQYNVPTLPQPQYINKKHIKKKYRKYYTQNDDYSTFTILED